MAGEVKKAGLVKRRSLTAIKWPQKPKLSPGGAPEPGRLPEWDNRAGPLHLSAKLLSAGL